MGNRIAPKIFTVGAAVWDVFLRSPAFYVIHDERSVTGEAQCVALGTKIESDMLVSASGGGATNAAVTFARLGFPTSLIARLGDDDHGRSIAAELEREGVSTDHVVIAPDGQTGYSSILMTDSGERSIISFRGVSKTWSPNDIPDALQTADAIYVTSLAGDIATLKSILQHAARKNTKIFFNPGMGEIKKADDLLPLLQYVDTLIVNLEEARALLRADDDLAATAQRLTTHVPRAIVTDGPRGAVLASDDAHVIAYSTGAPSVSRTGAGDAFGSGFTAAIMHGYTAEDALRVGTLNAESVISHIGAKVGILHAWPTAGDLARVRIERIHSPTSETLSV